MDYSDAVKVLIESDSSKIKDEIFNIGYQNLSIPEIALIVKKWLKNNFQKKEIKIIKEASDDKRSYHINSDKIKNTKFSAKDLLKML